ncbi:MAG: glycerate kinase [Oscillospiraceae bacterium]|nr:glycerate kinase [Oscillospiraceae bacterium]
MTLREDAEKIIQAALQAALPDTAVRKALAEASFGPGRLVLVAAGKAAWQMAAAAVEALGDRLDGGVVVTKYGHSKGPLGTLRICEAGHPVPDENSYQATQAAIDAVEGLTAEDTVLFLLSGGGSALFEKPRIPPEDLDRLTRELLSCGAAIVEMNTIRKRFSAVKGGRFAQLCAPAKVFTVVLSDIIGDPLDMIASGPAYPDASTSAQALRIAEKYRLTLTPDMRRLLGEETPKELCNVETCVTGSVRQLCLAAAEACRGLGYAPTILTASLSCTARDAGEFLASIAQYHQDTDRSLAFIAGGETVVRLTGKGLGGRNQELALAAASGIGGLRDTAVFSLGSDGTDGPTDAAGGYVDGSTAASLAAAGVDLFAVFQDNDAYHALERCGGLLKTGPTGTNVNDISVLLIRR